MAVEIKPNFFANAAAAPAPVTMPVIQFVNDPAYRRAFGTWLADNFNELAAEYKAHGRFLTLQELQDTDSPLDF